MTKRRAKTLALALVLSVFAAACGSSGDDNTTSDSATDSSGATGDSSATTEGGDAASGGELVDGGTFVGDPPNHIDPALNNTLDAYQVINMLYDGLTDIDATDAKNPKIVPDVATTVTPNADASVWTFKIRDDEFFSNGEQVMPSSFTRAWNRAAKLAGPYSYLVGFIQGGADVLDGKADTISGAVADDATMTLTVTLSAPYANFDAIAGFQIFMPMPSEVEKLEGDADKQYENGMMVGNGPFKLETPRTDETIVLVPNPEWNGSIAGVKKPSLSRLTFKTIADPDTSYNALEAGENDTGQIPPGRVPEAQENWGTTLDTNILGTYYWVVNSQSPLIGGPQNLLLRQAINQAIDRDAINQSVYNGSRTTATGLTPPGIPGYKEGLCTVCTYDVTKAKAAFDEWTKAGGKLTEPITIQFNAEAGHEPVVAIVIDNLKAIGIEAVAEPMPTETYFDELSAGACKNICRLGWFADYPTYDNFMYDLFSSEIIKDGNLGNNDGPFLNPQFDSLVNEAKRTPDKTKAGDLYNQAETILLNDVGAIPINWYRGDYAFNKDKLEGFHQTNFGLIPWEEVKVKG